MSKLQKKIYTTIFVLLILSTSVLFLAYIRKNHTQTLLRSPLVQRAIPLYRSLRKLPDIVIMPWSAFVTSDVETYELIINPKNIERMNTLLPEVPFSSFMEDENKLWVNAHFRTKAYSSEVKVRYRGNQASHWNAYQKSYLIKFPKDNLFNGMSELTLVIPSKRRYFAMSLNNYRAQKLGLLYPEESLIRLKLNGANTGILLAFEHWSQPWVEKLPISSLSTIYGVNEGDAPYQERWKSWNSEDTFDTAPLLALQEIVNHADDETFKKIIPQLIDVDDWLAWDIMRILATGYHADPDTSFGANNLVLIFDRSEGRFKPVPYNTVIFTPDHRKKINQPGVMGGPSHLYQRILSIHTFRERRNEMFATYVANEKENDLAFIKNWRKTYNREFLSDSAKNDNHFSYLKKIRIYSKAVEDHFDDPFEMLTTIYTAPVLAKDKLELPQEYKGLLATIITPEEALLKYPVLSMRDNSLYIQQGIHQINQSIVIPVGTKLTIAPGAELQMAEGVSLISYSPVEARGIEQSPIIVKSQNPKETWGVFAVLNTKNATNTFSHITLDGGSEKTFNGSYISGTLALHNSNSIISKVTVQNAQGDDGINIKGGYTEIVNSSLINNISDGVDLDYVHEDSVFMRNTLTNNHGDAIDISWSDLTIKDNMINRCGDKGISIGESSIPTIYHNTITECAIAIAVKDSSRTVITANILSGNITAFSLYQKKPYFNGAHATATDNTLWQNDVVTYTDNLSTLSLFDNTTSTIPVYQTSE